MKAVGWIATAALVLFGMTACSVVTSIPTNYNKLVAKDTAVEQSAADVQVFIQRQANLIPAYVEATKAYVKYEGPTFIELAKARSAAGGVINVDPSKIANDPALQQKLFESQQQMTGALGRLLVVVEKYPELKANRQFENLEAEMTGSQNRIAFARTNWNNATQDYNQSIRTFPTNLMISTFGWNFKHRNFYTASVQGPAAEMPAITFSDPK